jgi:hypothetical protein
MRVIEYPPEEQEYEIRCSCGALLGYTDSEVFYKDGVAGTIKFVKCILCGHEIKIGYTPYPQLPKGIQFWY